MLIYILVPSVIFWLGYNWNNKNIYRLCLFILFALTAFRAWTLGGSDAWIYHAYFLISTNADTLLTDKYEVGYALLNYLVRSFSDNYYVYQVIYALLTTFLLHLVLSQLKINWSEKCILLFSYFCLRFIYNDWIALRQNIANLLFWFFLLCIYNCDKEKKWKRILLIAAALVLPNLFHSSAAVNGIFLIILWLFGKLSFKTKVYLVPTVAVILHFIGGRILGPLVDFMTKYISERYSMYEGKSELSSNRIYFILRLMFFAFFCYRYYFENNESKQGILDLMSMTIMIGAIDLEITSRVFEYFAIGLYASMGTFFNTFDNKSKSLASYIYYACMMVILVRFLLTFHTPPFLPYQTWN